MVSFDFSAREYGGRSGTNGNRAVVTVAPPSLIKQLLGFVLPPENPTLVGRAARARSRKELFASRYQRVAKSEEHLYAFVLYTSGESDFGYVCASASTEESLAQSVQAALNRKPGSDGRALEHDLRWSACDWAHHDFSRQVEALSLPSGEGEKRDAKLYADFIASLPASLFERLDSLPIEESKQAYPANAPFSLLR